MSTDATNPVGGEDTVEETTLDPGTEVETEGQETDDLELDEDGNPIEDEDEEVDLDDLKLKVPKDQAQKVREALLRQADYTRKTQELAEQRKAFDGERQNITQATQQELAVFAQASNLGQRLATFQRIDWNAWNQQAQANFDYDEQAKIQAAWMEYQQVKDAHANAMGTLGNLQNQRVSAAQQEIAKRVEEGRQVLVKDIGWNDELKAKLTDYALAQGLSRDDLGDLEATPAAAKILRDAYEGHQARQKQQAANKHLQAQQAQPAATVSTRRAPPSGLDDRLSIDEWTKRREAQLAKKGR
jgi:hypothetical protein